MTTMSLLTTAVVCFEYEENLSLRYLASAVQENGFRAELVLCNDHSTRDDWVRAVLEKTPILVGISVPFQHRAEELLSLAEALRARGYRGHICAGGHF